MMICLFRYPERDLNPHSRNGQRILSPSCLPFHHPGGKLYNPYTEKSGVSRFLICERKTGLEPATPTLARLCSTNWAISANFSEIREIFATLGIKIFFSKNKFHLFYIFWFNCQIKVNFICQFNQKLWKFFCTRLLQKFRISTMQWD